MSRKPRENERQLWLPFIAAAIPLPVFVPQPVRPTALRVIQQPQEPKPGSMLARRLRAGTILRMFPEWEPLAGVPLTRGACSEVQRPCPFTECKYHLWLYDERAGNPSTRARATSTLLPSSVESCALDVAEQETSAERIAVVMGTSKRRVEQVIVRALKKMKAAQSLDE